MTGFVVCLFAVSGLTINQVASRCTVTFLSQLLFKSRPFKEEPTLLKKIPFSKESLHSLQQARHCLYPTHQFRLQSRPQRRLSDNFKSTFFHAAKAMLINLSTGWLLQIFAPGLCCVVLAPFLIFRFVDDSQDAIHHNFKELPFCRHCSGNNNRVDINNAALRISKQLIIDESINRSNSYRARFAMVTKTEHPCAPPLK